MAVTVQSFRGLFPEFADTSDTAVTDAITQAAHVNSVRDLVTAYIAAHFLTVDAEIASGATAAHGALRTNKVGPISNEFVTLAQDGDIRAELARTQYGARALLLESRSARSRIGAVVAG